MNIMHLSRCSLAFLLICLISTTAQAQASATDSLNTFIKDARSVQAEFSQTLLDKSAQVIQESTGTMLFERPGKFRWIYKTPYEQLIVGDGDKVWFYDEDLNQVTVRQLDLAIGSSPAALLAGNSAIEENFEIAELGVQNKIEWLEAVPKTSESSFEFIQLGFSLDGVLQLMVLRDNFGQTTLLTFTDLKQNIDLPATTFTFVPPDDADVISD